MDAQQHSDAEQEAGECQTAARMHSITWREEIKPDDQYMRGHHFAQGARTEIDRVDAACGQHARDDATPEAIEPAAPQEGAHRAAGAERGEHHADRSHIDRRPIAEELRAAHHASDESRQHPRARPIEKLPRHQAGAVNQPVRRLDCLEDLVGKIDAPKDEDRQQPQREGDKIDRGAGNQRQVYGGGRPGLDGNPWRFGVRHRSRSACRGMVNTGQTIRSGLRNRSGSSCHGADYKSA